MPLETDKSGGYKHDLTPLIQTGMYPEVFSHRVPLWDTATNVQFTEFGVEKIRGDDLIFDTGVGAPVRGLVQNLIGDDFYVFAGDLTQLYEYNTDTKVLAVRGTGYTLAADSGSSVWDSGASTWDADASLWDIGVVQAGSWSMINYGNFIMATNGADAPQIQKTVGTNFVDVIGMDVTTVEIWQKRGPHVLGFNTSTSFREFIWCDADDVDVWVAAADNLAGQLEIRELKTPIKAAVPLGDRIAVYGEDQMFLVNYLANDLVFGYQPAINGIGSVSKNAIVPVGRKNYGLSAQGFFATDGTTFEYIDDPMVKHWRLSHMAPAQQAKVVGHHDETNYQIIWAFPTESITNNIALSYNYKRNSWSFLDSNTSSSEERNIASHAVVGTEVGLVLSEGASLNNLGSPLTTSLLTKGIDFENPARVKELDSLRVGVRGKGLKFRVGWSEEEGGVIAWQAVRDIEPGFDFSNLRTAGRWLYIEFSSDQLNDDWEIFALEIKGRVEGTR